MIQHYTYHFYIKINCDHFNKIEILMFLYTFYAVFISLLLHLQICLEYFLSGPESKQFYNISNL